MDFLKSVAKYYIRQLPLEEWSRTVFVFPNHRSSVFFSDAVSRQLSVLKRAGRPHIIFGLNISTIGDLLLSGGGLRVADQVTLRCELYDTYRKMDREGEPMRFETFYSWAGIIINDFEDLDKSLANPGAVYRNVTEWQKLSDDLSYISDSQRKAIEDFWNIEFTEEETPMGEKRKVHKRFVEAYGRMEELYSKFRDRLRLKGLAYTGMIYRDAAEGVGGSAWDDGRKRYVFIGFSLLSRAEEAIMGRLAKAGRADFLWDYEPWMLERGEGDDIHGAGYAVAQWVKKFPAPFGFKPPRATPACRQRVRLITTTYPQSQASVVASTILASCTDPQATDEQRKTASRTDFKRSVIVITDEQMLLPVLSVIPSDIVGNINVTMGYELRYTNISGLVHLMGDAQSGRNNRTYGGRRMVSAQVALSVLRHPYVVEADGKDETRAAIKELIRNNRNFVDPTAPPLASLPLTSKILRAATPAEATDYATGVLEATLEHFAHKEGAALDRETIWEALKVARRLSKVVEMVADDMTDARLLMHILCSMIDQQKVDFQGMPLGGLQLMGILETRAVDFDDVTVLDMVEGNWPKKPQAAETMIPTVIRRGNGMPTADERDSTYNYYFYRLKSRAKRLTLIQPQMLNNSQPSQQSRYVMQMRMLRGQEIEELSAQKSVCAKQTPAIEVDKSRIRELMNGCTRISPSSLSDYVECGLKFFFSRVLKIGVEDEISEEADDRQLGSIYHGVMEALYKVAEGSKGTVLTQDFLRKAAREPRLTDTIMSEFAKIMKNDDLRTEADLGGRNILTFSVIKQLVKRTLQTEEPDTVVTATEQVVKMPMPLANGREVLLNGTIDRMHMLKSDGQLYVADYKTGSVDTSSSQNMTIKDTADLFDQAKHDKLKALMQVMTYCYILRHGCGVRCDMTPYVLFVRLLHLPDGGRDKRTATNTATSGKLVYGGETEQEFDRLLEAKINEIFDESVPFTQCKDTGACGFCDYRDICRRQAERS